MIHWIVFIFVTEVGIALSFLVLLLFLLDFRLHFPLPELLLGRIELLFLHLLELMFVLGFERRLVVVIVFVSLALILSSLDSLVLVVVFGLFLVVRSSFSQFLLTTIFPIPILLLWVVLPLIVVLLKLVLRVLRREGMTLPSHLYLVIRVHSLAHMFLIGLLSVIYILLFRMWFLDSILSWYPLWYLLQQGILHFVSLDSLSLMFLLSLRLKSFLQLNLLAPSSLWSIIRLINWLWIWQLIMELLHWVRTSFSLSLIHLISILLKVVISSEVLSVLGFLILLPLIMVLFLLEIGGLLFVILLSGLLELLIGEVLGPLIVLLVLVSVVLGIGFSLVLFPSSLVVLVMFLGMVVVIPLVLLGSVFVEVRLGIGGLLFFFGVVEVLRGLLLFLIVVWQVLIFLAISYQFLVFLNDCLFLGLLFDGHPLRTLSLRLFWRGIPFLVHSLLHLLYKL